MSNKTLLRILLREMCFLCTGFAVSKAMKTPFCRFPGGGFQNKGPLFSGVDGVVRVKNKAYRSRKLGVSTSHYWHIIRECFEYAVVI